MSADMRIDKEDGKEPGVLESNRSVRLWVFNQRSLIADFEWRKADGQAELVVGRSR